MDSAMSGWNIARVIRRFIGISRCIVCPNR
jgi:hypothetical protein